MDGFADGGTVLHPAMAEAYTVCCVTTTGISRSPQLPLPP